MKVEQVYHVVARGWFVTCDSWPDDVRPRVGDSLVVGGPRFAIRGVESFGGRPPFALLLEGGLAGETRPLPAQGDEVRIDSAPKHDAREGRPRPPDHEETVLLANLRARGLNELADMARFCFGQGFGHASLALRELLNATCLGWTTGSGGAGAGAGVGHGIAFASWGGIAGGGGGAGAGACVATGSNGSPAFGGVGVGGGGALYAAPTDPEARRLVGLCESTLHVKGESFRCVKQSPHLGDHDWSTEPYDGEDSGAEHYGPVGAEPNRCNWMRGDERCSLPYPHDGRPHQVAAKETEPVP